MTTVDRARVDDTVHNATVIYRKGELREHIRSEKKIPALLVLRGAETGLRITISEERLSLGRTIDADIVLNDKLISRKHAEIVWDRDNHIFRVIDLDSTNGTFVNDRAISSCVVDDGDKIFLGSTILKFVLEDAVESESGEVFDRLMFQDDLTGLVVRRRFDNDLRVHLQSAAVLKKPIALLMMDMDGLKKVNDTHGHSFGAFVIAEVGKLIGRICQSQGEACRYGGDEFIAYVLEADLDGGVAVAEEIRAAVREGEFVKDGVKLEVTISIGVTAFPAAARTIEDLSHTADEALYRAKERGRDIVCT